MKIKPHGAWYLLPVGLLFISGIIAVVFFFQAVINPVMNVMDTTLNEVYDEELTSGSFIALYFEDEDVIEYEFYEEDDNYFFEYSTTSSSYRVEVEILRLEGGLESTGFEIVTFDPAEAYTVDEFTNFADVNILEDGTYRIIYSSYDDINIDFGLQFADWSQFGAKIVTAIASLIIGVPLAIISFIVIIVMRSNSKKTNGATPISKHIDPAFIKKEEKKDKEEIDKHFDY